MGKDRIDVLTGAAAMFFDRMDRTLIYPLGNVAAAWAITAGWMRTVGAVTAV